VTLIDYNPPSRYFDSERGVGVFRDDLAVGSKEDHAFELGKIISRDQHGSCLLISRRKIRIGVDLLDVLVSIQSLAVLIGLDQLRKVYFHRT